jgi:hypothetical protein
MGRKLGMDETSVGALLELAAAATEEPPSRVDVELARSRGRRKLWWRRASLAGASAAAVVAVAVAAVAVPGSHVAAPGRGKAPEAHAQIIVPRQFSLVSPYAAFGWLPPGDSLDGGTLSPTNVYLTAGPGPSWALTVFSPGFCNLTSVQVLRQLGRHMHPQIVCSDSDSGSVYPVTTVAAAQVDGHTAFWTAKHVYLIWQYAHGAWASLEPSRSAAAGTAIKVASEVSYGTVGSPVEYPAQLVNMPAGWTIAYVHFAADSGVLRASEYQLTGTGPGADSPAMTTDPATPASSCYYYPGGQSTRQTINGYQVTVNHLPAPKGSVPTQQVCAPDADGLMVFVSTYGRHASPNAISIFRRHLRLLGTNPAGWTTEPLG